MPIFETVRPVAPTTASVNPKPAIHAGPARPAPSLAGDVQSRSISGKTASGISADSAYFVLLNAWRSLVRRSESQNTLASQPASQRIAKTQCSSRTNACRSQLVFGSSIKAVARPPAYGSSTRSRAFVVFMRTHSCVRLPHELLRPGILLSFVSLDPETLLEQDPFRIQSLQDSSAIPHLSFDLLLHISALHYIHHSTITAAR